tara:strand:+ start:289 stop:519 length:231 start_codon:yes stop_codon:yes gene_type:complete
MIPYSLPKIQKAESERLEKMKPTVATEVVRAHTRLDGVDARLKKIEKKLDKMTWVVGGVCGVASFLGPIISDLVSR